MGFFSWMCSKSEKPVMGEIGVNRTPYEFASNVVVLFRNGSRVFGKYDGYGRVGDTELLDYQEKDWRMVIKKYYNGETFDQLPQNKSDPCQGFFYSDEELEEIFNESVKEKNDE